MRLIRLLLNDFRQFSGTSTIEFADDTNNVTVVLGDNGNGKTGIFRAINFCLFGEKILEKDHIGKQKSKVHLVNFDKVKQNPGEPVEAMVELEFESDMDRYILTRSVYDRIHVKTGKLETNIDEEVIMKVIKHDDQSTRIIQRPREINNILDRIISKKIKDLFFFDGDKIETLSTSSKDAKQEVKTGILRLLNIDLIEDVLVVLKNILSGQRSIIRKSSNTRLQDTEQKMTELEDTKEKLSFELEGYRALSDKLKDELERIDAQLDQNKEISQYQKEIKQKVEMLNNTEKTVGFTMEIIKGFLTEKAHHMYLMNTIQNVNNKIEVFEKKEQYNSGLTIELIDQIIETEKCICGTALDRTNQFYQNLTEIRTKQALMEVSSFFRDIKTRYTLIINAQEERVVQIKKMHADLSAQKERKIELQSEIEELENQISQASTTQLDLENLEKMKKELTDKEKNTAKQIAIASEKLKKCLYDIEKTQKELDHLMSEDEKFAKIQKRQSLYQDLQSTFIAVKETYTKQMREKLSKQATLLFNDLIAEKDRKMIDKILINDNYEIQAVGWNGQPIFDDISSGQKQMLSLSFVTALAKIASGTSRTMIDMPLFMDTPFAKLDSNNRASLLTSMPELASQWILLVTNTEMTGQEADILSNQQNIDYVYVIEKIKDGHSKIVRKPFDALFGLSLDGEEL